MSCIKNAYIRNYNFFSLRDKILEVISLGSWMGNIEMREKYGNILSESQLSDTAGRSRGV